MVTDLSQLFDLNPYVGSIFAGQREALAQEDSRANIDKILQEVAQQRQKMQFAADQHPLDLEKLVLGNKQTAATTAGMLQDNREKAVKADVAEAGKQDTIDTDRVIQGEKRHAAIGKHFGSIAQRLEGASDIEAPALLSQALDEFGMTPPAKAALMQRYGTLPAKDMQARLKAASAQILRENPEYARTMDQTEATNKMHIQTTGMNNRTLLALEDKRIGAGKYEKAQKVQEASDLYASSLAKAQGAANKYAAANAAVAFFTSAGELGVAAKYQAIADALEPQARAQINNAQPGKPGSLNMGGVTGLPTNPPADIRPPAAGAPRPAASAAPAIKALPPGSKRVGTSGGKPVYQTPDGKRFIGE